MTITDSLLQTGRHLLKTETTRITGGTVLRILKLQQVPFGIQWVRKTLPSPLSLAMHLGIAWLLLAGPFITCSAGSLSNSL